MSDIDPRENKVEQPEPSVKAFSQGQQRAVMNAPGQKGGSFMAKLHRVARNASSETDIELKTAALATREKMCSRRVSRRPRGRIGGRCLTGTDGLASGPRMAKQGQSIRRHEQRHATAI